MTGDRKEDLNKQMNEVRNSIQDLDRKLDSMEEKFSKELEFCQKRNKKQMEILEMKNSAN
jgi:hypothetical protein